MATVTIKNSKGGDAGSLELSAAVFEASKNEVLVREVYNATMANARQGTHSTKTRGMVRGGGAKPWKQKGTGRARAGSNRSPLWVGGAVTFGPQPRSYREKVNKKKRQSAFRALLTAKYDNGEIIAVDKFDISDAAKTKEVVGLLAAVGAKGRTLVVTVDKNENLIKAAGNLAGSKATPTEVNIVNAVSIVDLLKCDTLLITSDALQALQERLA